MDSKILYHGSPRKLKGQSLIPKQAHDLENNPDNTHKAVYATDLKELAITMAIICSKGVKSSSLNFNNPQDGPPYGVIYHGKPEQKKVYLYELSPKEFKQSKITHQFYSEKSIKPLKTEVIKIKDYENFFRYANKKEVEKWAEKIPNN